jgi:hypothetical protein
MLSISTKQTTTSHIKSLNIKILWHMMLEIKVLAWDRNKNVAGLNRLMGSHPPLLIILITLIKGQRYLPICTPILTKVFTCLYTYIDKGIYLSVHLYWQRYLPVCTPILTKVFTCLYTYIDLWWHLHIHTCKNNHHPISVPQNMSCLCIYTNL